MISKLPTLSSWRYRPPLTMRCSGSHRLEKASELIGASLAPGAIVVYESTVYPGATEEDCLHDLGKASGMKSRIDFKIGYSPERINPGDKEHTLERIIKVVSAQDEGVVGDCRPEPMGWSSRWGFIAHQALKWPKRPRLLRIPSAISILH